RTSRGDNGCYIHPVFEMQPVLTGKAAHSNILIEALSLSFKWEVIFFVGIPELLVMPNRLVAIPREGVEAHQVSLRTFLHWLACHEPFEYTDRKRDLLLTQVQLCQLFQEFQVGQLQAV